MPTAPDDSTEIDCPYFEPDWVLDHPNWPADSRLAPSITDPEEQ